MCASGGTFVVNAAQAEGLPRELLGVRMTTATAEADSARCVSPNEATRYLERADFRYQKVELNGAAALIVAPNGDPLVTINKLGKGKVVFSACRTCWARTSVRHHSPLTCSSTCFRRHADAGEGRC